mmetsp:Transcript_2080/g.2883  ORF Transcript_2080/g.2883 Transcript_2080/m.2883 type:complete len:102 (+) Transcript_2080:123-428(+)
MNLCFAAMNVDVHICFCIAKACCFECFPSISRDTTESSNHHILKRTKGSMHWIIMTVILSLSSLSLVELYYIIQELWCESAIWIGFDDLLTLHVVHTHPHA